MIDIGVAKRAFKMYSQKYSGIGNKRISLKIAHMYRVANLSKEIAEKLDLNQVDIQLAELIGLLHDIGRFEQIKVYDTFMDKDSINHAEYGVKVLFDDGLIQSFVKDRQYDEIIKNAILNHNKAKIENVSDERQILHCKIIKDADKVDILYQLSFEDMQTIYGNKKIFGGISRDIFKQAIQKHNIDYKLIQNSADDVVAHMMYPFNFYYDYGLKIVCENNYLEKHIERLEIKEEQTKQDIQRLMEITKDYIQSRIKEVE